MTSAACVSSAPTGSSSTRRICLRCTVVIEGFEIKIKGGAIVYLSFRPHASAVAIDDPLHVGEADAGALEIALVVQPLKHAEEFVGILRVETGAVVPDEKS